MKSSTSMTNRELDISIEEYDPLEGYGVHRRVKGKEFCFEAFFSPHNSRIRVLKYEATNYAVLVKVLLLSAMSESFGKVFIKAQEKDAERFELLGFEEEATIPGYFGGRDAKVMSYFADELRAVTSLTSQEQAMVHQATANVTPAVPPPLAPQYVCRQAGPGDAEALASLFRTNFESYPFPVFDPAFVLKTMEEDVHYQVIEHDGTIVAVASGDIQTQYACAEMTDFATLSAYQGQGFAHILLGELEKQMVRQNVFHLHTLARASSPAMNRTFAKMGYELTGTLVQNCNISGKMEDMNCWGKTVPSVKLG